MWYQYTPTADCGARVHAEANEGGAQLIIAAFIGTDCNDLTEVFCSWTPGDDVTFDMAGGTTHWVLVGHFWCEEYQPGSSLTITFDCSLGACCVGETCTLETLTSCDALGGYYGGDHSTCTPDLCLYGACCTSNGCELLTASDCAAAAGDFKGNGVPCALDTCPPTNDGCATSLPITDGTPAVVGNNTLTSDIDDAEASCQEWSDKDLWYEYAATCTGTVAVDTEGRTGLWDTILSVWDECGGTEIACDDNSGTDDLSYLEFDAIAGRPYYIRVASLFGAVGDFNINIACNEAPQGACCFGDTCTLDYQLTCEDAGGTYGGDGTSCPGDDCNNNGVEDICDILSGFSADCNDNRVPDECDLAAGTSLDRDANGVPDECDPDCNENDIIDGCDVSCAGGCAEIAGCGRSADCQGDGVPDECQLEHEGCTGVRYDSGYADLVNGVRPDWGWAFIGVVDDFTLDEDVEGTCLRFDIYDQVDSGNLPTMRVRIYENYDGLMNLGSFWSAVPVFDQTFALADGNLEITDTGEDLYGYDLLRFIATGAEYSLNAGDYAMHLTFPDTWDAGFWATSGTDGSDCAVMWGDWQDTPRDACAGGDNLTWLSFALLGQQTNDCNGNDVPDECDITGGTSTDYNGNAVPDECDGLGDLNCDDVTDYGDISPFVKRLVAPEDYFDQCPDCPDEHADINGNGHVGFDDINPFVDLLTDG